MKRTLIALALGLGLSNAVLADNIAFDEPYWKQALDRSAGQTTVNQGGSVAANEGAKAELDRAGFPQYSD
jgi:hypothetical protein